MQSPELGAGNSWYQYYLGDGGIETSPTEKDLGALVDGKLPMSRHVHLSLQYPNIPSSVASREVILSLYSTVMRPHLECHIQLWAPQHTKDTDLLEWVPRRGMRDVSCLL